MQLHILWVQYQVMRLCIYQHAVAHWSDGKIAARWQVTAARELRLSDAEEMRDGGAAPSSCRDCDSCRQ